MNFEDTFNYIAKHRKYASPNLSFCFQLEKFHKEVANENI